MVQEHLKLSGESERLVRLRKDIFSTNWPLDDEIREIARSLPSHRFLANPSGQYSYVYLTRFVKAFSEQHWESHQFRF